MAELAIEKKGEDVLILAMDEAVGYTDYFVIVTATSTRHTKALADEVTGRLRTRRHPARVEGGRESEWILIDYIDVVVHLFTPLAREYYRPEHLWGDVPRIELNLSV